jgi:hypothetical protein
MFLLVSGANISPCFLAQQGTENPIQFYLMKMLENACISSVLSITTASNGIAEMICK